MVKFLILSLLLMLDDASAHIKPVPHIHIGLFHIEDIILAISIFLIGILALIFLRRRRYVSR
ncbi:MAG TPA: hypothetical protein EYP32_01165 [Aquificaceae bacterium]|nr:hypothetical protein [Aquificaceae bacterium]HIQ48164.1 hypothetical protein [Aquifex aeolicus]